MPFPRANAPPKQSNLFKAGGSGRPVERVQNLDGAHADHARRLVLNLSAKTNIDQGVQRFFACVGAKVVQQWAVLGPYDFVNIVEAPDEKVIARVSVELAARGTAHFQTLTFDV